MKKSESFTRKVLNASLNGIYIFDVKQHRHFFINHRYTQITGYNLDDLKKIDETGIQQLFHPEDMPRILKQWEGINQGDEDISEIEYRYRTKSGQWIWCLSRNRVFERGADGSTCQIIGTFIDITDRKKAEDALRESERRFRMVVENSWDGIHQVDLREGRYVFISPSQERLTGFKTEELMLSMEEAAARLHPDDYERVQDYLQRIISGHKPEGTIEYRWLVKSGEYRWFSDSRQAIFDENGDAIALIGISRDITETKEIQAKLENSKKELERKIAERTALAEARANQLQALAVELIEAEEQERRRIAQLLHEDLQQTLAAIQLQLRAARTAAPSLSELEVSEKMLGETIKKARRLSHDLSPAVLQHFGLIASLEWLISWMKENFDMEVEIEKDGVEGINGEPLKVFLFRAVRELLFNVVKHANVKRARVEIAYSGESLALTISDRGRGIDPEILDSFSVNAGLGLASIRERARYLGGDLKIERAAGRGSRITLTVPIGLADVEQARRLRRAAKRKPGTPAGLEDFVASETIRVLFVDDHDVMRQGLIKLISGQPEIQVTGEAANGKEAIERALMIRPDVILMDVSMPEMNGIEATRRIRKVLPHVHVIGLSMFQEEEIEREMRRAGAEAFLSKTVSSSELLKTIYQVVRQEEVSSR